MKAFSPDIFTEQKTSDLLNESNSILLPAEKSLIAFKTDCIRTEIEARRKFYKRYITESCDNVVMEKMLMDREIEAIHEAYEEYAKTHSSDSIVLENGLTGATIVNDNISIDECIQAYDLEIETCIFNAIQEEAKIFSESDISEKERFEKLQSVNEALGEKIRATWEKIIAVFEQVLQKFIQKIKNAGTASYCERYKKIILEKPFKETDIFKTQNLVEGYKRVSSFSLPILDLENSGETLDKVETYVDVVLKSNAFTFGTEENRAMTAFNENKSLETFNGVLKAYFCMTDHPKEYKGPEFEAILKNGNPKLYDCLTDYMPKLQTKLFKEIGDMKRKCKVEMEKYGKSSNNEAVYSQIFQSYLVLENGVIKEADEDEASNETQTQQQTTTTQQTTQNTDNGNNTNTGESKKKAPAGGIIPNRCATYTKVATSILRAEISAIEFIRSETMKAVRYHVRQYIGNDEYDKNKNTQENQQNQ